MESNATQPHKTLLPDIDWVEIPTGPFRYGEGASQQEIQLERFYISRYPITNRQYQCFIDAGGYEEKRWWQDRRRPQPTKSTWEQPNRPRTDVDWYEAVAFTRWLSEQLNQPIQLPTEQEWEKAARGEDGRKYPWGEEYINGYANVDESREKGEYLQQTTAVGLYPKDHSPYGVRDMAGNVWEWCLNKWDHPEQIEPDTSGDRRVLRGGAWVNDPDLARAANRVGINPVDRGYRLDFRVVLSAHIVSGCPYCRGLSTKVCSTQG
jgi:formylglycine-generating enzyme required for sulfatase activity